jgi:hypothetical protein
VRGGEQDRRWPVGDERHLLQAQMVDVAEITVEVAGQLHSGPSKTRAGRRSISLPRSVADELGHHLGVWAGPDLVFTGPQGGPLRVPAWRRRFWGPAVVASGLQP